MAPVENVLSALSPVQTVLIYGVILLALMIGAAIVASIWRRRLNQSPEQDFDVGALDVLHRRGLLSDEEFSRLRRKALKLEAPLAEIERDENSDCCSRTPHEDVDLGKDADNNRDRNI